MTAVALFVHCIDVLIGLHVVFSSQSTQAAYRASSTASLCALPDNCAGGQSTEQQPLHGGCRAEGVSAHLWHGASAVRIPRPKLDTELPHHRPPCHHEAPDSMFFFCGFYALLLRRSEVDAAGHILTLCLHGAARDLARRLHAGFHAWHISVCPHEACSCSDHCSVLGAIVYNHRTTDYRASLAGSCFQMSRAAETAHACREVAVVYDESKLAPLVAEYNATKERVKDLTDEWVGSMRAGSSDTSKPRKYIKRKRVKLGMLPGALGKAAGGFGGAGKVAEEHFGKDAQDADELEYAMFKMKTLLNSIRIEQEATRGNVCPLPSFLNTFTATP
jgi:hypothetical protein